MSPCAAPVAHTWYEFGAPDYRDVERLVVKLDYDPRRATQIVEELGYVKGSDGFFRDVAGQPLVVQSMTNAGDDVKEKMLLVGADYWKAIVVGVETVLTPRQRASDREYRATFPGFDLVRLPFEPERVHSSEAATPENRFGGKNRTRYMNPELDTLIDRYFTTIPTQERLNVLGNMLHIMSDQVIALGVFYGPEPMLINKRLINVNNAKAHRLTRPGTATSGTSGRPRPVVILSPPGEGSEELAILGGRRTIPTLRSPLKEHRCEPVPGRWYSVNV